MAFFECTVGGGDGLTLTVTCYSGFAGLTISITNGVDTFTEVCPSTSPYEVVFDGLANGTWTLSTVYNGITYTQTVEINAVTQFYPIPDGETVTPTDDIQTWLHCANIWDKNYSTISQVLADTTTLLALVSSNNAADYMARSTTWASDVCADQTAMGYIGNNDYCANKLLADSTWAAAICNSTYFESVLDTKVPTMTSDNTPSGEVLAGVPVNNQYGPLYYSFDGNDNTFPYQRGSEDLWTSGSGTQDYVRYHFANPVCIKRIASLCYTRAGGNYPVSDFKETYYGSNDNSNWTLIYEDADWKTSKGDSTTAADKVSVNIPNNNAYYTYIKHGVLLKRACWDYKVKTLQFYGREQS